MSFCIRSISTGSKYVPTLAQGCAARRISSRHLPKHVKPVTSSFLNEFLGPNALLTSTLDIREEYKLTNVSNESNERVYAASHTIPVNYLVDCYDYDIIEPVLKKDSCELESPEINRIEAHDTFGLDQSFHSYGTKLLGNQISVTYQENSLIAPSYRTNFSRVNSLSKDDTKAIFSSVPNTSQSEILKRRTVNSSSENKSDGEKQSQNDNLEHVYKTLSIDMPRFFVKSVDYKIYHPQIEFVNNIRGKTYKGIVDYVKQLAYLRIYGHVKYAYVKMDVLKITMHTQDNTVRVRWRINGITGMKVVLNFWKFKFWRAKESALREQEVWIDGFSTFYVGDDGLVFKHVADKMMPDQELDEVKPKTLPSKLATQLTFSSLQ